MVLRRHEVGATKGTDCVTVDGSTGEVLSVGLSSAALAPNESTALATMGWGSSLSGCNSATRPSASARRGCADSQSEVRSSWSTRSVGRARRWCTYPYLPNGADEGRRPAQMSEQVGDLVVRGGSGLALVSEALGKLTTIVLVLVLELDEVA